MSREKAFDMELFFAALADQTRRRLLNLIGDEEEVCVCYFVEVIKANQPKISPPGVFEKSGTGQRTARLEMVALPAC